MSSTVSVVALTRLQDMVWPFDPDWTHDKVYDFLASQLSKEEFYLKHWGQPRPEDVELKCEK